MVSKKRWVGMVSKKPQLDLLSKQRLVWFQRNHTWPCFGFLVLLWCPLPCFRSTPCLPFKPQVGMVSKKGWAGMVSLKPWIGMVHALFTARQYISIYFIKTEQIKKEEQKSKKKKSQFLFKDI